jgi:hypothetical protein
MAYVLYHIAEATIVSNIKLASKRHMVWYLRNFLVISYYYLGNKRFGYISMSKRKPIFIGENMHILKRHDFLIIKTNEKYSELELQYDSI